MTARSKWLLIAALALVALVAVGGVAAYAWVQYQARASAPSGVETGGASGWGTSDSIVFRNTAIGQGYGLVASVPLGEPAGPRALTSTACDRVDATPTEFVCLRSERGIVPSYTGTVYGLDGQTIAQWPIPGVPSRTRFSPDGSLVATTAFVTGHSYATVGFSTETLIRRANGDSIGNLEQFALIIDGAQVAPVDRNLWGVTFVDDNVFYATAGTGGKTYLVKGDIAARTLTSVAEGVECPSLSPDGTRIAFKRVTAGTDATTHWTPAVLDLGSGAISLLPEDRSIDDQIEWLDDSTILYGMPRDGVAGDSDVWRLAADGSGAPAVFIEHAWSPSVVRAR
ncbi:PD40 domain-containing protein [Microbacterium rhizomatis]|uniref:PD40 domain-containing protein n=1 Tax=Microbacterium rhizomatis TaxID=1631477 RepID=UPI001478263E|nr:PD40 domain-containing protein [Microbacterium rhizomatis]